MSTFKFSKKKVNNIDNKSRYNQISLDKTKNIGISPRKLLNNMCKENKQPIRGMSTVVQARCPSIGELKTGSIVLKERKAHTGFYEAIV